MAFVFMIVRAWLGSMFVYSAGLKLAHFDRRQPLVKPYRILPTPIASTLDFVLPWAELLAGVSLLFGHPYSLGPSLGALLGTSFTYASSIVLLRKDDIQCGCTGTTKDRVSWITLARALSITFSSLLILGVGQRWDIAAPGSFAVPILLLALLPGGLALYHRVRNLQLQKKRVQRNKEEIARVTRLLATSQLRHPSTG
jgi:uncharacterized membrane protein YphA (DoxX/SURF4 family)